LTALTAALASLNQRLAKPLAPRCVARALIQIRLPMCASERESLVPVPIGDLDETIDAAIKENHAD